MPTYFPALTILLAIGLTTGCGDTQLDSSAVTTAAGEAQWQAGTNLSRPAWLPKAIVLPAGLEITSAVKDPEMNGGLIYGTIDRAPDVVAEELAAALLANGFELSKEPSARLISARQGQTNRLEIRMKALAGDANAIFNLRVFDVEG